MNRRKLTRKPEIRKKNQHLFKLFILKNNKCPKHTPSNCYLDYVVLSEFSENEHVLKFTIPIKLTIL